MALALAGAACLLSFATGVAIAGGPSGNARAVAFARSVVRSYGHVPGISYTQRGYSVMEDRIGPGSFFGWSWGTGYAPSGWVAATDHVTVGLAADRVLWVRDDLTPHCGKACGVVPIEVMITRAGDFWRPKASACYRKFHGSPYKIGSAWISLLSGHYGPLTRRGGSVLTHFSYRWGAGRTATQTDVIGAASRLIRSYRVSVSPGSGANQPAFKFSADYDNLARAPSEPKISACS